jgi:hypothetical protein
MYLPSKKLRKIREISSAGTALSSGTEESMQEIQEMRRI